MDRRWVAVVGARPNLVKLAPLVAAAREAGRDLPWIHTGQHADEAMGRAMERDLGIPEPRARLRAPPAGPGRIGAMEVLLRGPLASLRPSLVVVLGDVDSTVAGARCARRLGIPVAHVEAGLRSFEPGMPEERNRKAVDRISDVLHVTEPSGRENLLREGCLPPRIHAAGNVMVDALRALQDELVPPVGEYVVATLHRQRNVDDPSRLAGFVNAFREISRDVPVVFPVHPRTRKRLPRGRGSRGVRLVAPLPYRAFLGLVKGARGVVTDSGGLQVECAVLHVRCVTARRRTEHLLTLSHGTNRLAGDDPSRLASAVRASLDALLPRTRHPRAWDGRAATRIVGRWERA